LISTPHPATRLALCSVVVTIAVTIRAAGRL
jgi:hypothetical protein